MDRQLFQAESNAARLERTISRLCMIVALLIVLLVGTNFAWLYYESQWERVQESTQIEATQEGSGTNIIGGGNITYGTESENK